LGKNNQSGWADGVYLVDGKNKWEGVWIAISSRLVLGIRNGKEKDSRSNRRGEHLGKFPKGKWNTSIGHKVVHKKGWGLLERHWGHAR